MATYGQRFREVRKNLLGSSQEQVRDRLKLKRQSNISAIETTRGTPKPATILRHAKMLGCEPSELLDGVETEYDKIRAGAYDGARAVDVEPIAHKGRQKRATAR